MTIDLDEGAERDDLAHIDLLIPTIRLHGISELPSNAPDDLTEFPDRGVRGRHVFPSRGARRSADALWNQSIWNGSLIAAVTARELLIIKPHRQAVKESGPFLFFESRSSDASGHCGKDQVVSHEQMNAEGIGPEK